MHYRWRPLESNEHCATNEIDIEQILIVYGRYGISQLITIGQNIWIREEVRHG